MALWIDYETHGAVRRDDRGRFVDSINVRFVDCSGYVAVESIPRDAGSVAISRARGGAVVGDDFVPLEVELDEAGLQVLAMCEDGQPFSRYVECLEGCGYYIGVAPATESAWHASCAAWRVGSRVESEVEE